MKNNLINLLFLKRIKYGYISLLNNKISSKYNIYKYIFTFRHFNEAKSDMLGDLKFGIT